MAARRPARATPQADRARERGRATHTGGGGGRCLGAGGEDTRTTLKVVVFDETDYAYARKVGHRFPEVPVYLQVGNDRSPGPDPDDTTAPDDEGLLRRYAWLADKVLDDGWNEATVLPQLHVLVWGNGRGV